MMKKQSKSLLITGIILAAPAAQLAVSPEAIASDIAKERGVTQTRRYISKSTVLVTMGNGFSKHVKIAVKVMKNAGAEYRGRAVINKCEPEDFRDNIVIEVVDPSSGQVMETVRSFYANTRSGRNILHQTGSYGCELASTDMIVQDNTVKLGSSRPQGIVFLMRSVGAYVKVNENMEYILE